MDNSSLPQVQDEAVRPALGIGFAEEPLRTRTLSGQGVLPTTETEPERGPDTGETPEDMAVAAGEALESGESESAEFEEEPAWTDEDIPDQPFDRVAEQADPGAAGLRPARLALFIFVYAAGVLLFLVIEPTRPWVLLVTTGLVTIAADGIIRTHQRGGFAGDIAGTAPYLFLPALYTLGSGLFLEDVASGYWAVPGIVLASVLMSWFISAEYVSVDEEDHLYPFARLVLNVGTYLTAFAFFAVVYTFDVSLVPAAIAVGLVTLLLSIEVLREAEADPVRALVYATVIGIVVAEARWDLYFLPLESYLAAVFLLLVFYLGSGLVQHHLTDDLRPPVVAEFFAIAVIGVLIVAAGRIFESTVTLRP